MALLPKLALLSGYEVCCTEGLVAWPLHLFPHKPRASHAAAAAVAPIACALCSMVYTLRMLPRAFVIMRHR